MPTTTDDGCINQFAEGKPDRHQRQVLQPHLLEYYPVPMAWMSHVSQLIQYTSRNANGNRLDQLSTAAQSVIPGVL